MTATLGGLLLRQARRYPDRVAVTDGQRSFDYRSLSRLAAGLADSGVRPGEPVGLFGPRDAHLLALLYGVLAAGGAVVPISQEWALADVRRRLDWVGARRVIAAKAHGPALDGTARAGTAPAFAVPEAALPPGARTDVIDVEALAAASGGMIPLAPPGRGTDLAYVAFTSGSAGEPKAVAVTHANALHYAGSLAARLSLGEHLPVRAAHVTTLAADLGHTSWLLALATAGWVHVVPDMISRDPVMFWETLRASGVTLLKTTPSHLAALLDGWPGLRGGPPLANLLLGGEALPRCLAARLFDGVAERVVNHYGPTETTIGATCFVARSADDLPADEDTVPIGTPIGHSVLRLEDESGGPVTGTGAGELLIGGEGVSAGYIRAPERTAEAFVTRDGRRMYRTGDICRRRPDGSLVFVGRADQEVKIRGYRVDPAEIERALEGFPEIAAASVVVRTVPGGHQLLGAIRWAGDAGGDQGRAADQVRERLRENLPEYSVPSVLVTLAVFPLGPNGKLDRTALAEAVDAAIRQRAQTATPGLGSPLAQAAAADAVLARRIAGFWATALGMPEVGIEASVLDLGGDSILAVRTVALLHRAGHRIGFDDFYRHPTSAGLAAVANHLEPDADARAACEPEPGMAGLTPAQRWFLAQEFPEWEHWNQAVLLRCRAGVDGPAMSAAVADLLHRHPSLRHPIGRCGRLAAPRPAAELAAVSFSAVTGPGAAQRELIERTCAELQRGLDPEAGLLARVHLFRGAVGGDRLALVIHHLAVDGVSWRILLGDLAQAYRAALASRPAAIRSDAAAAVLRADAPGVWSGVPVPGPPMLPAVAAAGPRAVSWSLCLAGTQALKDRFGHGPGLEALLLAAFATALRGGETIEVETHGRDAIAAARLDDVGWFTAIRRVAPAGACPAGVERMLREAPVLPMDTGGPRPAAGFNFLGVFHLPAEPTLDWVPAAEWPGDARCAGSDPLYRIRLTARIVAGRLVTDLVPGPGLPSAEAERIATEVGQAVARAAGTQAPAMVRAAGSTSGHILHQGRTAATAAVRVLAEPPTVLLTGATGYLGGHLLAELTRRGARVVCLVRGVRTRLAVTERGSVEIVVGDIAADGLGLSADDAACARQADLVVHAAADVRLLAPPAELERTNTQAVRRLLCWTAQGRPGTAFHHISTLAVSGRVPGGERRFCEADLQIGQTFLTSYERSKFNAEEAVREWTADGRTAFVYRSGHIAAHSETGVFQPNLEDNRIYQMLRGYVLAGCAPRRSRSSLAFSHADTVAAGIAAIALQPQCVPGTYHVESPHEVPHDELVAWLEHCGYPVKLTCDETFETAMLHVASRHPRAAALATSWTRLPDRHVRVDQSRTIRLLARLGVQFAPPTPAWLAAWLSCAASAGFLPPPARLSTRPSDRPQPLAEAGDRPEGEHRCLDCPRP
jgi:amino acid adenylation domain-containing protein/thioester reductase-like protein